MPSYSHFYRNYELNFLKRWCKKKKEQYKLQNAFRKGVTWKCRQPWSCRVSTTVSPAHWQRGRRGLTGYVRAANKCLNGRVGPKKGSVYRQTGWHHPDNGAARGSPILHLTSPKHNHKKTHALAHADMLPYTNTHTCIHRRVPYIHAQDLYGAL